MGLEEPWSSLPYTPQSPGPLNPKVESSSYTPPGTGQPRASVIYLNLPCIRLSKFGEESFFNGGDVEGLIHSYLFWVLTVALEVVLFGSSAHSF